MNLHDQTCPVIVHLLSNRWNSAISEYALNAAKALKNAGISQLFVALSESPAAVRAKSAGLTVIELQRFSIGNLPALTGIFKDSSIKAVFTYGGPETFLTKWLKTMKPDLRVIRFRGDDRDGKKLTDNLGTKLSQCHVDVLLAPSDEIASRLDSRARLVEPAIDLTRVSRSSLADPGPGRRNKLTILGRLDPVKGHAHFFELYRRLMGDSALPYSLTVVGEPANLSVRHLEAFARDAGLVLGHDVEFISERVADISGLLSSSCVGVVSSIGSEIICRVAQEFLVCGTPILVSGVGSLREYVFAGHGFNYGPGQRHIDSDTEILAFLSRSAQETVELREGRAGFFSDRFGLSSLQEKLIKLLQDCGIEN